MPDANAIAAAESAVADADGNLKQKQVELLAAQRGADPSAIETAENNLHQAEVELLAAREKLKFVQ
jgi:hypothetical protein